METSNTPAPRKSRDWNAIIAQFRASGQSQRQFCKERGLSDVSLCQALKRIRKIQGFIRADLPRSASVVVELPNGIRVSSGSASIVDVVIGIMRGK